MKGFLDLLIMAAEGQNAAANRLSMTAGTSRPNANAIVGLVRIFCQIKE